MREIVQIYNYEDVVTDCKSHKVVVKGEKADPLKVLERVQRKSHRQVELLSPIPKPPSEQEKKIEEKEKPKPKEEKKTEEPKVMIVILKVHMYCEACSQEIKRRIEKIKGMLLCSVLIEIHIFFTFISFTCFGSILRSHPFRNLSTITTDDFVFEFESCYDFQFWLHIDDGFDWFGDEVCWRFSSSFAFLIFGRKRMT